MLKKFLLFFLFSFASLATHESLLMEDLEANEAVGEKISAIFKRAMPGLCKRFAGHAFIIFKGVLDVATIKAAFDSCYTAKATEESFLNVCNNDDCKPIIYQLASLQRDYVGVVVFCLFCYAADVLAFEKYNKSLTNTYNKDVRALFSLSSIFSFIAIIWPFLETYSILSQIKSTDNTKALSIMDALNTITEKNLDILIPASIASSQMLVICIFACTSKEGGEQN